MLQAADVLNDVVTQVRQVMNDSCLTDGYSMAQSLKYGTINHRHHQHDVLSLKINTIIVSSQLIASYVIQVG